ncbi:aldo/keto reductase [Bombiscardovia nodaiensis]|uniref:Aldo/keto reductase n=1 Tax=Bombiscardovia nodaiensis TaxID=2932181 RepID=A0ABM8B9Y8_9BIFI|nr:aldo/keto reductase [Bombiscardovia nodaiensis]
MKQRKLGGLTVSEVGMSCMVFSRGHNQPPAEEDSIAAIRAGYEAGCTYFDTAENYGKELFHLGHNEELVGKALAGRRHEVILASKFHLHWRDFQAHRPLYQAVRSHLDKTLHNLGTDYLDLYYMQRTNPQAPVADIAQVMEQLVAEGLIRGWGMSQVDLPDIQSGQAVFPLTAVQDAYSMAQRSIEEEVISYCAQEGIGFVAFSPIASYYLSSDKPKFDRTADQYERLQAELLVRKWTINRPLLQCIQRLAGQNQASPAQISLAWMLHKFPNLVPVPGSKHPERIFENLASADIILSDEEVAQLDELLDYCWRHDRQVSKLLERNQTRLYHRQRRTQAKISKHSQQQAHTLADPDVQSTQTELDPQQMPSAEDQTPAPDSI